MKHSFFAAAAAVLFGAGIESAQAQCCCSRPKTANPPGVVATSGGPCCIAGAKVTVTAAEDPKPAAQTDKEVTLTGTMVCAKCGLKEPGVKTCMNAIQVKDDDKTITYLLEDKGSGESYHEGLCGGGTKAGAKVTGTVSEKDGKRMVKVTKVEEKK